MTSLDEVAATIENLPEVLRALLAPIDPVVLTTAPEPGEWSVHEVIGHLITCDVPAFRDRIADIVAGAPEIAPFEPNAPVAERAFDAASLDDLLDELAAIRAESAAFVRQLAPGDLSRTSGYGAGRRFTAGDFVHEWPFHDADHLQQILENVKLAHVGGMSSTMRRALDIEDPAERS